MPKFNLTLFLAQRLSGNKRNSLSRPIVNISIIGVSLGLMIMIIAIAITEGYKKEIRDKVVGMGSHIRISNYDDNYSFEAVPFEKNHPSLQSLAQHPDIRNIQFFATKTGIIKTDDQVEGVILKGVDTTFYWHNFQKNIITGNSINAGEESPLQEILISSKLSKKLKIELNDKVRTYFVQDPPMQRSFTVVGIFETGLPDFDEHFAIVDLRHVVKLNHWDSTMVGGIEILVENYDKSEQIGREINEMIGYELKAETVNQIYPQLFEWIDLFDTNIYVLMAIIIFVCIITMISTFFIIVLEQTPTIGMLKAMGMQNGNILSTFMFMASRILIKGVLIGDGIALLFAFLQKYLHIIKLDASVYYVNYIPVELNFWPVFVVNVGVLVLCLAILVFPAYYIAKKISPVNAIRFN